MKTPHTKPQSKARQGLLSLALGLTLLGSAGAVPPLTNAVNSANGTVFYRFAYP